MREESEKIDFVIIWVDGNDPAWQKEKKHYLGMLNEETNRDIDAGNVRYRDWDNLKYWFRAVEKYAPWVNKVHFVTCGQKPDWLNVEAPKLHLVHHKDYIPAEYLPTFSSHPIELNLHRIEELSEHFVYFNDDFFLTAPVEKKDFFVGGLPCDCIEEEPVEFPKCELYNSIRINDIVFMNRHFDRHRCRHENKEKWYSLKTPHSTAKNILTGCLKNKYFFGMAIHHLPQAYCKKTLKAVWENESEWMHETCSHRFRDSRDISQHVFKFWQLMMGQFYPYDKRKFGKALPVDTKLDQICEAIQKQKYKAICINDADAADFDQAKKRVIEAFEKVLPEKSSYEL